MKKQAETPPKPEHPSLATGRFVKRVVVDFSANLYAEAERSAAELGMNRSGFIRLAVRRLVADVERKRLRREMAEGYAAMAGLSQQVLEDFEHVDSEAL